MKKRIFSVLLFLCIEFLLISTVVYAANSKTKAYENVDFKTDVDQMAKSIDSVSKKSGGHFKQLSSFGYQAAALAEESALFSNLQSLRRTFFISGTVAIALILIYFVWNIYLIRRLQKSNKEIEKRNEQLEFLSYRDMLTSLYNRHKYMETLHLLNRDKPYDLGAAYIDLNGLKRINDSISHKAGDEYICSTAKLLQDCFGECCYRIGGDEFVVLAFDINKADFMRQTESFKRKTANEDISISIGYLYQEKCSDPIKMVYEAEKLMYLEKQKYYRSQDSILLETDIEQIMSLK